MQTDNVARLRTRLLTRKAALHDEIRAGLARAKSEGSAGLAQETHDLGDESFADVTSDVALADVRRDAMELRDVETALRRMDLGTYGTCASCKGAIGPARLEAYPTAKRCLKCETAFERATETRTVSSL